MESTDQCSKCSTTLDTEGYPKWCKACRAKYKREYESLKGDMAASRGFSQGVEAMAQTLALEFGRKGPAMVSCSEVAGAIQVAPRPRYQAE